MKPFWTAKHGHGLKIPFRFRQSTDLVAATDILFSLIPSVTDWSYLVVQADRISFDLEWTTPKYGN
jgi:hypothetical protein